MITVKTISRISIIFSALLCIASFLPGCLGLQKKAVIELAGNPTTGYSWEYTMSPENIIREVSNEYIADKTETNVVGSGGKFVFTFEAVTQGETTLVFSYRRPWEDDPPAQTITYKALVDGKNNITLIQE